MFYILIQKIPKRSGVLLNSSRVSKLAPLSIKIFTISKFSSDTQALNKILLKSNEVRFLINRNL